LQKSEIQKGGKGIKDGKQVILQTVVGK